MEQVIYADVLFAVNFSMDFLSLYLTGRVFRAVLRPAFLTLAAGIGALYGTASLFLLPGGIAGRLINVAVAVLMCRAAFGSTGFGALAGRTAVFYACGFMLGGVMTALYNLINSRLGGRRAIINGGMSALDGPVPLPLFVALAAASGVITAVCGRIYSRRKSSPTARLEITVGDRTICLDALCDSGNLALEPLGGLPVIFLEKEQIRRLYPERMARALLSDDAETLCRLPPDIAKRTRIIPLTTVSGSRVSVGALPDRVRVNGEEKRACVAAGNGRFGGCDAMIPSTLI